MAASSSSSLHSMLSNSLRFRLSNALLWFFDQIRRPRVHCALCGWRGYRFRTIGSGSWQNPNQLCPKCKSYPRHRTLFEHLRASGLNNIHGTILDIGAGASFSRLFDSPQQTYLKADIQPAKDVNFSCDIQNIPLTDGSVELVICLHVLDHVADDAKAMREIERVLVDHGTCILQSRVQPQLKKTVHYYPDFSPSHTLQYRDYGADFPSLFHPSKIAFSKVFIENSDCKEPFYIGKKEVGHG